MKVFYFFVFILTIDTVNATEIAREPEEGSETITLACGLDTVGKAGFFERVYGKAFSKAGYKLQMVNMNLARALREVEQGRLQGLCARVEGLDEHHPNSNLLRVDFPVRETSFVAWGKDKTLNLEDIENIGHQKLRVGIVRGAIVSENFVKKHNLKRIVKMPTLEQAIALLDENKVDIVLAGQDLASRIIKQQALADVFPIRELFVYRSYTYLHRSRAHLIPHLESFLSERYSTHDTKSKRLIQDPV